MASVKLFWGLLFVAFLAQSQAELDIDELERDLQNSDWTEEPIDDSDEVTGRDGKGKSDCSCVDSTCGCCIKSKVLGMPACINVTTITNETKNVEFAQITVRLNKKQVAKYNFTMEPYTKICNSMRNLRFLSLCVNTNNTNIGENGFVSCTSMEIMVVKTTAAMFKLSCVQFKDNQLTFFDNKGDGRKAWFSMKLKSNLQRLVQFIQNE